MSSRWCALFVLFAPFWGASALRFGEPNAAEVRSSAANQSIVSSLDSSPNATLAKAFLDSSIRGGWKNLPIGLPVAHRPLLPIGVLPYPSLFQINEKFDFGGLTGSTYYVFGLGQTIIFNGNFLSRHFGHDRTKAHVQGQEAFQTVRTKHVLNPFKYRYSYRVLKPSQKKWWGNDDVLFTLNRDMIGRGFFGIKDEWRIYSGREQDGRMVYYCVQSWWGWQTRCWHSKLEYESGRSSLTISGVSGPKYNPCAVLSQVANLGAFSGVVGVASFVPDQYYLFVNSGEDSALLMTMSVIIDSAQDEMEEDVDLI